MILKLGEADAIQLLVSSQVLTELDNVIRRKGPNLLGLLTLLLDRSGISVVPPPAPEELRVCQKLVSYHPDAQVLAAAWSAGVDYFVTLDRKHFLDNTTVQQAAPFLLGTPGDFLEWYKAQLF
jgi:predicted nucleic acid-binding protein